MTKNNTKTKTKTEREKMRQNKTSTATTKTTRKTKNGDITSFHNEKISFEEIVKLSLNYNFDVLGIMHTSVDLISDCVDVITKFHNGPVMAYPDSGYFKSPNWQFSEIITPNDLAEFAVLWVNAGVNIIGGCCGLGPEHTKALSRLRKI